MGDLRGPDGIQKENVEGLALGLLFFFPMTNGQIKSQLLLLTGQMELPPKGEGEAGQDKLLPRLRTAEKSAP